MQKKYLVTGASGFVGPHMLKIVEDKECVSYGLTRDKINKRSFLADITNRKEMRSLFKENNFDGVFHLAAQTHIPTSIDEPTETFRTNVLGTMNICEAIMEYSPKTKLLFSSSSCVYGQSFDKGKAVKEGIKELPMEPYGNSKLMAEIYIKEKVKEGRLNAVIARPFSHTGPGRARNFSISSDAYQIAEVKLKKRRSIEIGNLDAKRSLMDVRDCAKAYFLLMERGVSGECYNISQIRDFKIEKNPSLLRKVETPPQIPDCQKIKSLGWRPKIKIEQTLEDLLSFCEEKIK
jgi:GDP-4-dehydro-6-deoxy-D-mannose reductase